ncbi:hypothetical protein GLOTRDRAFT_133652 [Gloeophyllum trabeum ATCC 11539]|uniref:Methyltransferase n=1 Tax=Gloeophyllum trabeum (strain ATCC 11539 / FP-39264 / Madison 617) TaxID=670483 RepID=S7REK4_GLOTA|nr:uncharacterized protein GLOTRDRAFT_133652 [Gloeophyllum trabeum ATCC 11539]EPQ50914.1 hypothetical protein GLOTRDRAFT_133652 [Gloeophyllum trabeum ATCC 11539]
MSSTVTAKLYYFVPPADGSRPWQNINANPVTGAREQNFGTSEHEMAIENVRGREHEFTLDKNGFQFYKRPSKHTGFTDNAKIREEYYPESIELIKELTGASQVVLFDHTIRRRRPNEKEDTPDKRQPVPRVHVDQTQASAIARVHRHLPPSEAPQLVQRRFQIINLWRPINHPALDWPLAFCDFSSVDPNDFVPTILKYPDYNGETMSVKFNPNHKWKYLKGMTPDEFALIKCFDSKEGVAKCTPHTGFEDPSTPPDAPLRESIELRALVFFD